MIQKGVQCVASLVEPALDSLEERSSECAKLRPVEVQLAPERSGVRRGRGSDRLDRISSGIYERAVRLQLGELQKLVCLSVAREFRPKLAGLKEQIKADILSLSAE